MTEKGCPNLWLVLVYVISWVLSFMTAFIFSVGGPSGNWSPNPDSVYDMLYPLNHNALQRTDAFMSGHSVIGWLPINLLLIFQHSYTTTMNRGFLSWRQELLLYIWVKIVSCGIQNMRQLTVNNDKNDWRQRQSDLWGIEMVAKPRFLEHLSLYNHVFLAKKKPFYCTVTDSLCPPKLLQSPSSTEKSTSWQPNSNLSSTK